MRRHVSQLDRSAARSGFLLWFVLVVTSILALGAWQYADSMLLGQQAAHMHGEILQTRMIAESAIEYTADTIGRTRDDRRNLENDVDRFACIPLRANGRERCFTVGNPPSPEMKRWRFGLTDCSAKLNVNVLARFDPQVSRRILESLPNIDTAMIDGIIELTRTRELSSLEELLAVTGVTSALLYGEDRNRNGILDDSENDADFSLPIDNQNGILDAGWSHWLTTRSAESNVTDSGEARININDSSLPELYDRLVPILGPKAAKFIVAYRLYGPMDRHGTPDQSPPPPASLPDEFGVINGVQRGGLSLSRGARYMFDSVFDLVEVNLPYVDESGALMASPWKLDSAELADLEELLTPDGRSVIPGRLAIFDADPLISQHLPGLDGPAAARIHELRHDDDRRLTRLLTEQIVDLPTLRKLAPHITNCGDVFRTQVVAFSDTCRTACRLDVCFDATEWPARVLAVSDLTQLGLGKADGVLRPNSER